MNKVEYKDANGKIYKIGDIVHNPCMGDFWLVCETTDYDKEVYKLEDNLCLALYGDKEYYVMDITEPAGFTIFMSTEDEHYLEAYNELKAILTQLKKVETEGKEELNNEQLDSSN